MAKPVVDTELCSGCGTCEALCPEVFQLEDEKSIVISGCDACDCQEVVDSCPEGAISLE